MYTKRGGVAAYHTVRIGLCLRSVPGVRVLASAVDDWLLCRMGEFASCLQMCRGGWCRLSVVQICCHTTTLSIHTTVV